MKPSAIALAAADLKLPLLQPSRLDDDAFIAQLKALAPDCCPIVAYGGLVPRRLLSLPRHGWINLHFSLLPAWRGAAPVQHALLHGDEITGATTFSLDEGLDTGQVFGVITEEIRPTDTAGLLLTRLALAGAPLLVETLDGIEKGSLRPAPQPAEGVSYAPKISVEDARIDWSMSAVHVDRLVRACHPAPGAWPTHADKRLKLLTAEPKPDKSLAEPGLVDVEGDVVLAGCGISAVRLIEVQPEGKRPMSADAWARGARAATGERLH